MEEKTLGSLIEDRLAESGMTKAEFGRRINTSRQNVSLVLRKENMDTSLLAKICTVLDYNFFQHLAERAGVAKAPIATHSGVTILFNLSDPLQREAVKNLNL